MSILKDYFGTIYSNSLKDYLKFYSEKYSHLPIGLWLEVNILKAARQNKICTIIKEHNIIITH